MTTNRFLIIQYKSNKITIFIRMTPTEQKSRMKKYHKSLSRHLRTLLVRRGRDDDVTFGVLFLVSHFRDKERFRFLVGNN